MRARPYPGALSARRARVDSRHRAARSTIELLIESSQGRMPDLVPIRYGRMLASVRVLPAPRWSWPPTWRAPCTDVGVRACGDAHPGQPAPSPRPSGGSCSTSTTSAETFPAPWEWDLKRTAASFVIASRRRPPAEACHAAATHTVREYAAGCANSRT